MTLVGGHKISFQGATFVFGPQVWDHWLWLSNWSSLAFFIDISISINYFKKVFIWMCEAYCTLVPAITLFPYFCLITSQLTSVNNMSSNPYDPQPNYKPCNPIHHMTHITFTVLWIFIILTCSLSHWSLHKNWMFCSVRVVFQYWISVSCFSQHSAFDCIVLYLLWICPSLVYSFCQLLTRSGFQFPVWIVCLIFWYTSIWL